MGCAYSEIAPRYAVEEYPFKDADNPNLLGRHRFLNVPTNVVAPSCTLADIGEHAYQSMLNSPKRTKKLKRLQRNTTDDVEEPPNHESVEKHLVRLSSFMTYVTVHPNSLRNHVAQRRETLSPPETDSESEASDYGDVPRERGVSFSK